MRRLARRPPYRENTPQATPTFMEMFSARQVACGRKEQYVLAEEHTRGVERKGFTRRRVAFLCGASTSVRRPKILAMGTRTGLENQPRTARMGASRVC